jgi:polysaccharide deacetylase 2 family uncharacterized protein YibQ
MRGRFVRALFLFALIGPAGMASAETAGRLAPIAIIIDDLGNERAAGLRTLALPGPVTCSFLPGTPYARALAQRAHADGKEVMLHLPMQAVEEHALGPGAITLDMTEAQLARSLADSLGAIPHVRGVNNHMGSLLTRHPGHMDWLMRQLAVPGLFFVDSRTTAQTVADRVAAERQVPFVARDVFLDARPGDAGHVVEQIEALIARAKAQGGALGIGHPYPETLWVLESYLHAFPSRGVRLVPVSELIELRQRSTPWRESSFPWPKAAKS